MFMSNATDLPITVNSTEGKLRIWRNTSLASLASGTSVALAQDTVGYESNEDVDNGFRPKGLIDMSTTTGPSSSYLTDFGSTTAAGTTTHHITLYKASSGALVFSAGTIQWAWGLDQSHDGQQNPRNAGRNAGGASARSAAEASRFAAGEGCPGARPDRWRLVSTSSGRAPE